MDEFKYEPTIGDTFLKEGIEDVMSQCYEDAKAKGWHDDPATGLPKPANPGDSIMLMVCELAEAFEGYRKGENDHHLPHRPAEEVELADALIRICHYARRRNFDLGGAVVEKLAYNRVRKDHTKEERLKEGGKKF